MDCKKDYYKILGVSSYATQAQIKDAAQLLLRQWHPDKYSGDNEELKKMMTVKFQDINEAYSVLQNTYTRGQYDNARQKSEAAYKTSNQTYYKPQNTNSYSNNSYRSSNSYAQNTSNVYSKPASNVKKQSNMDVAKDVGIVAGKAAAEGVKLSATFGVFVLKGFLGGLFGSDDDDKNDGDGTKLLTKR